MKKRLYSLTLVFFMLLKLSVCTIAAEYDPISNGLPPSVELPLGASSTDDIVSPDTEATIPFEEVVETAEYQEVLNVVVPSTLDFTINPFELRGRGQVYSEAVEIENRGETDVLLTFTNISVSFANETDFEALAEPFDELSGSGRKSIYIMLDFGRNDISPVIITDLEREEMSAILLRTKGNVLSSCVLSLSGSVNHAPDVEWRDGDVKINLTYRIDSAPAAENNSHQFIEDESDESLEEPQSEEIE